jgi:hypothetical protein
MLGDTTADIERRLVFRHRFTDIAATEDPNDFFCHLAFPRLIMSRFSCNCP